MAIAGVFLFAAKYAGSWEMLIVGRLVIGINSGLNAGIGNYRDWSIKSSPTENNFYKLKSINFAQSQ